MQTNWHNVRMYTLIAVTFIVAGLQAIHNSAPTVIDSILIFLTGLEHAIAGNSSPTVN